ncbi:hypothetical protein [Intrasporangium sp. DVR]|uniref:hypothetical protein n=1 Tax=Intrasporangium sp. DVR TaxID=3127867 RepID=UPI00313A6190
MVTGAANLPPLLVPPDDWFAQGDVFYSVPLPANGEFEGDNESPALLITHGCALDKKSRLGHLRIERLNFLPLQNVAAQEREKQLALRSYARDLNPSEVLYLGHLPEHDFEAFVVLSQPFTLPAAIFDPTLIDVRDESGNVIDTRLSGRSSHRRIARLSDCHVELFKDKMNAFWTRRAPMARENA